MDNAEVIQVIRTTLTKRGDGKTDPIRVITQYWSLEGQLLAEVDPTPLDVEVEIGSKVGLGFSSVGYAGGGVATGY